MNDDAVVLNPGGRKSGGGTPYAVSDVIGLKTDKLLELAEKDGFGTRNQGVLKALVCFSIDATSVTPPLKFME
jgi:hypothetical protein